MTERTIQNGLFGHLSQKGYLLSCPNYTPAKRFECDLFAVTKANRFVEFEIKVSRSDFKADAKKGPDARQKRLMETLPEGSRLRSGFHPSSKHDRLALADTNGPSRFFYVVPEDLVAADEIPEWAGLMHARMHGQWMLFREAKKAPKLHNQPVEPRVVQHMASVMYWRFWNLRRGIKETELPS